MLGNPLNLFFPKKCPYCERIIDVSELECEKCRAEFTKIPYIYALPSGNKCITAFLYTGKVRDAIMRYKFKGKRDYFRSFSMVLAERISDSAFGNFDIITSVPLSRRRLRSRGYNQSALVAKELSRLLSSEYLDTLEKIRNNREQHSLNHEERQKNIIGVYQRLDGIDLNGKSVLLVDDIVTTGNTLSECCRVLSNEIDINLSCAAIATARMI